MNKNKRWSEAERTLILELYWQLSHEEMDKLKDEHPKIIALAEMLGAEDKATSIYLRLLNFTSLDPNAAAALPHVGKKDKELWENFYNQWDKLAAACQKAGKHCASRLRKNPCRMKPIIRQRPGRL